MMLVGVHVSAAGRIYDAVDRASALGCGTMQFFSRNPQQWRPRPIAAGDADEFRRRIKSSGITPVFIHIPYLINLASPEKRLYAASIDAYIQDIAQAEQVGADYIVTHMGSHRDTSVAAGLDRLTCAVREILRQTRRSSVGILLENTSGAGSCLGYTFEHHRYVIEGAGRTKGLAPALIPRTRTLLVLIYPGPRGSAVWWMRLDRRLGLTGLNSSI